MAKEVRSVAGRVVAITGGARGIGRATAEALVRRGAKVAIGDLDPELTEQVADEIGADTIGLRLDVTDRDSFESFLAQVEERLGPLDVLVNNAGIMPLGRLAEEDDATAKRMVDINLHGVIYGTKLAIPRLERRGIGHIVNVASTAGKGGFPGGATYCATKHAVVGLSEAVRAELRDTGVEVSVVMPVVVKTELATGLEQTRGLKAVEATDVAEAIVAALERPKFDVFVPASAGYISKVMGMLPRGGREWVARALKADKVLADADPAARAAYEDRAAHSEPGLEPEALEAAAGESSSESDETRELAGR